ncbi:hypothetical protein GCM10023322_71610 [Rugosimonospora acidiphila]|uniref:FbpC C-terminal regulatory nucleotide binding domain-containing protein n=1 Tax=Rugosimonospora acidiphila TaxID=556531 RepID=A0ABP9SNG7_9ACTN
MGTRDEDLDLDDELVALVRGAAADLPGYPGDVASIRRRRAARRRRQTLYVGLSAALVATVLFGGVALFGPVGGPAPLTVVSTPPASPTVAASPPAPGTAGLQRLFFVPYGQSSEGDNGAQVGVRNNDDLDEVLPDGRLLTSHVPGLAAVVTAMSLPDGGFVALGTKSPTETTPPPGAAASPTPAGADERFNLAVVGPDGRVRSLRDTAALGLIGTNDQRVFMYDRQSHLLTMDLATGRQQALSWPALSPGAALAGGHFVELQGDAQQGDAQPPDTPTHCTLRVLDDRTGAQTSSRTLPVGDCDPGFGMRLSPDGQWLAVAQATPGGSVGAIGVLLINVATGQQYSQVLDQVAGSSDDGESVDFQGMAWLDAGRLRIAWTHLPAHPTRMYDKSEVLRLRTVATPGA